LLSLSADVKPAEWLDPARHSLRQWLQRNSPALLPDSIPFSEYFQAVLMEQLESFIDAFITHMPDVLRKLRVEEDEQRQLSLTHDHDLDLERFLVIISFAFEGRPDAAQAFWSDSDSNLVGFLHWASRRTTTPLLSAFCEMLQALSEDEICATKAHEFLLGEATSSSGKIMRSHSLTWDRVFRELTFYSSNLRDRPTPPKSTFYRGGKQSNDQAEAEPESAMMLESYLRLMTRLCTESTVARAFLFEHPTFSLTDLLYQLASSENVPSRLRACAFTTLRSLLTHKTKERSEFIWKSLDAWVSGSYSQAALVPRSSAMLSASSGIMDGILQRIFSGYEECNAFIQLLHALVAPFEDNDGLNDSLPFPELLGSSSRMPGIDPYVDFVGQVFQAKPAEANDHIQQRLLSLVCLQFIAACLGTFNEDLIVFANQSNIVVDNAIKTSDLASYVRLHPFSRMMEWIFNDGVMAALFGALHQDVTEVGNAAPDSPLILCLMHAIDVVALVIDLQATYLDIVRPLIKLQPNHRRNPVANAAFASFEDGILNNLSVITDLGLYCGAGHALLTVASLKLLEVLSTSPKLVGVPSAGMGRFSGRNKAIVALESNNDSERIARSLTNELLSNLELDEGPESDTYLIKIHILNFLNTCLEAVPGSPSIAYLLLGFQCGSDSIEISHDGPFSKGTSLFHSILSIAIEYPVADQTSGMLSWLISIKSKAFQILKALWQSPLSSDLVMTQLRGNEFLINMVGKEIVLDTTTLWDGRLIDDERFTLSSSSNGYIDFIRHRASLFQYVVLEFRQLQKQAPAVKEQAIMAMLGFTISTDGLQVETPTIFDLFDFMELEIRSSNAPPELYYFKDVDLSVCLETLRNDLPTYNIKRVQELTNLRRNELRNIGHLPTSKEVIAFKKEAQALVASIETENQSRRLAASRLQALEAWVQVMLMIIETGGLAGEKKVSFVLQSLQVILPKFETYCTESLNEALMLANLAKFLLFNISFSSQSFQNGDLGDLASDRLFQLFGVCLKAIPSPIANPTLKEMLYSICYRYITGMSDITKESAIIRKHSTLTIKAAGERLIDVICDDAYAGEQTCRISALLLLGELSLLARQEDSKYIIDALTRLNFIDLVVDSIKNILAELRESKPEGIHFCPISQYITYTVQILNYRSRTA
jgi:nuclear pore complex protein Nup205